MERRTRRGSTRVETDAALLWEAMKRTGLSGRETAELALREAIAGKELLDRLMKSAQRDEKG